MGKGSDEAVVVHRSVRINNALLADAGTSLNHRTRHDDCPTAHANRWIDEGARMNQHRRFDIMHFTNLRAGRVVTNRENNGTRRQHIQQRHLSENGSPMYVSSVYYRIVIKQTRNGNLKMPQQGADNACVPPTADYVNTRARIIRGELILHEMAIHVGSEPSDNL